MDISRQHKTYSSWRKKLKCLASRLESLVRDHTNSSTFMAKLERETNQSCPLTSA